MFCKPVLLIAPLALLVTGCGGAPESQSVPLAPQTFDVSATTTQAMQQLDRNQDGKLTKRELELSPSMSSSMATVDRNRDGIVQQEELQARLQSYVDRQVSIACVPIVVTLRGEALVDAKVVLVPEKFMEQASLRAEGITDHRGIVRPEVSVDPSSKVATQTGFYSGFYKVMVSKRGENGQELLPPRFNTRTTLGIEVKIGAHTPPIYLKL